MSLNRNSQKSGLYNDEKWVYLLQTSYWFAKYVFYEFPFTIFLLCLNLKFSPLCSNQLKLSYEEKIVQYYNVIKIISSKSYYWLLSEMYCWKILKFFIELMIYNFEFGSICSKVDKLLLQRIKERKCITQRLDHGVAWFPHFWYLASKIVYFFYLLHCLKLFSFTLILNLFPFQ